jgi:hypothetical protein
MLVIADFNTSGLLDNYLSDLDISQWNLAKELSESL